MFPKGRHHAVLDCSIDVGLRRGVTSPPDLAAAVIGYEQLRIAVRADTHFANERASLQLISPSTHSSSGLPQGSLFIPISWFSVSPSRFRTQHDGQQDTGHPAGHRGYRQRSRRPGYRRRSRSRGRVEVDGLTDPPMVPIRALWLPYTISEPRTVLLGRHRPAATGAA